VLQKHIDDELGQLMESQENREMYLRKLYELYGKIMELHSKLGKYEMSIDMAYLAKLVRFSLFHKYLSSYAVMESQYLATVTSRHLEIFCARVGISRKSIGTSRVATVQGGGGGMNVGSDETYVSMEVCTNILHEARESVRRASSLLVDKELSVLIRELYFIVLDKLCTEHFLTALDIAQSADPKSSPTGLFCLVVGQVNSCMHLIELLYRDTVTPCISYAPEANKCLEKKREITLKLEAKIEAGIERSLSGMVSSIKSYLSTFQKKTDFKPEDLGMPEQTEACQKVVVYVVECRRVFDQSLDGKNLEVVLLEFGMRIQRVIYDHIQQFVISENGAMNIICDMNEYRKAIKDFKNPFLDELFESLQALCNIFIVKPENLPQVCSEEPYTSFDRSVLSSLVALRADYKPNKLAKLFT
jgi:recyclin-1